MGNLQNKSEITIITGEGPRSVIGTMETGTGLEYGDGRVAFIQRDSTMTGDGGGIWITSVRISEPGGGEETCGTLWQATQPRGTLNDAIWPNPYSHTVMTASYLSGSFLKTSDLAYSRMIDKQICEWLHFQEP